MYSSLFLSQRGREETIKGIKGLFDPVWVWHCVCVCDWTDWMVGDKTSRCSKGSAKSCSSSESQCCPVWCMQIMCTWDMFACRKFSTAVTVGFQSPRITIHNRWREYLCFEDKCMNLYWSCASGAIIFGQGGLGDTRDTQAERRNDKKDAIIWWSNRWLLEGHGCEDIRGSWKDPERFVGCNVACSGPREAPAVFS